MLGSNGEDYLKTIYSMGRDGDTVTPSMLAENFSVSPAAVTKMVKRLRSLKLVNYSRATGLALTKSGEKIALEILRHHRLIELYLQKALGYSWDQVHDEAERLEHVISEVFEEKIDEFLGHPTHDPHGDPIPSKDGALPDQSILPIMAMQPGEASQVQRVDDSDASMLQYMDVVGLVPGAKVQMMKEEPYGGSIHLKINGAECAIGRDLASNVFVQSKKK